MKTSVKIYSVVLVAATLLLPAHRLLHMGICYEKQGSDQARKVYRDVMN